MFWTFLQHLHVNYSYWSYNESKGLIQSNEPFYVGVNNNMRMFVQEFSDVTAIGAEDILATLRALELIQYRKRCVWEYRNGQKCCQTTSNQRPEIRESSNPEEKCRHWYQAFVITHKLPEDILESLIKRKNKIITKVMKIYLWMAQEPLL